MEDLTHISLFAGIAGIDLAAEWAGFRTILFVEIDPFCQKVLKKHWPDVPIIGDIKDATKKRVMAYASGRQPREQKARNGRQDTGGGGQEGSARRDAPISTVTLITGGFPCQPVSVAGKRRGQKDDRWLWPEMLRVISEVRPAWVVAENVTGLLYLGFYDCLSDLEGQGYETISFLIPACGVFAPHRRDRIFIVANSRSQRWGGRSNGDEKGNIGALQTQRSGTGDKQGDVADSEEQGLPLRIPHTRGSEEGIAGPQQGGWWAVEPGLGRVAYGVPDRVDRLKALGNAVVPQQIYPILKAIAEIEQLKHSEAER